MKISSRWYIIPECWVLSNIPSMKLCGVEFRMFMNCEKYCLSLFHSYLGFKQEWNKWRRFSSSSFQYEHRRESTSLNLKNILSKYNTLFNNLYWNILRFVSNVTRLSNKQDAFPIKLKIRKKIFEISLWGGFYFICINKNFI